MRNGTIALVALLAGAGLLAGCAQSEDRVQARDVAQRFYAALADHDGAAACALLSAPTRSALEDQERRPCAEAIGGLELGAGPVRHVRVYVTTAQAELGGGESAYLDRDRDGWRMSAAGCRFEHGKPADRPATCEVES